MSINIALSNKMVFTMTYGEIVVERFISTDSKPMIRLTVENFSNENEVGLVMEVADFEIIRDKLLMLEV